MSSDQPFEPTAQQIQNAHTIRVLRELRSVSDLRKVTDLEDDLKEMLNRLVSRYQDQQSQLQNTLSEIQVLSELRKVSDDDPSLRGELQQALQALLQRDDARRDDARRASQSHSSRSSVTSSNHEDIDAIKQASRTPSVTSDGEDETGDDATSTPEPPQLLMPLPTASRPSPPRRVETPRSPSEEVQSAVPPPEQQTLPPPPPPPPAAPHAVRPTPTRRQPEPVASGAITRFLHAQEQELERELDVVRQSTNILAAREGLARFMTRHQDRVPSPRSSAPNNEPHTPAAPLTEAAREVQHVEQQGNVARLLARDAFRAQLERVWNVGSLPSTPSLPGLRQQQRPGTGPSRSALLNQIRANTSTTAPPPPRQIINDRQHDTRSRVQQAVSFAYDQYEARQVRRPDPAYRDTLLPDRDAGAQNGSRLVRAPTNELRSEEMAVELHDLEYREPVRAILDSEFRGTLERLVRQSLERSGLSGRRPVVRVGPPPPRDFAPHTQTQFVDARHIPTPGVAPAHVTGSSNRTTSYELHARHVLERQVTQLQDEVAEMKRMLQQSFEMHLETQRCIRQELAAGLAARPSAMPPPPPPSTGRPLPSHAGPSRHRVGGTASDGSAPAPQGNDICLVCCDAQVDSVLYSCGHMCTCNSCARSLVDCNYGCPLCRAPIREVIRVYRS